MTNEVPAQDISGISQAQLKYVRDWSARHYCNARLIQTEVESVLRIEADDSQVEILP